MVKRKKVCGVYRITVRRGDQMPKYYVGHSSDIHERWLRHLWELRLGRHRNPPLQAAFHQHGEAAFTIETVCQCARDRASLVASEQIVLAADRARFGERGLYNVHIECVASALGVKRSPEALQRQSAALRGRKLSPEQCKAISERMKGQKLSPESIAKRTAKQSGIVRRPETLAKMSEAQKGRVHSPETRARISAGKKGQRPSPEHLAKLAEAARGRPMPDHVKVALIASHLGKKKPPEEIAKRQATRAANAAARMAA